MANREARAREVIRQELDTALAYRGTEQYAQFVRLLDAIEACLKEELMTIPSDALQLKQGAARQTRALRDLLVDGKPGDTVALPLI